MYFKVSWNGTTGSVWGMKLIACNRLRGLLGLRPMQTGAEYLHSWTLIMQWSVFFHPCDHAIRRQVSNVFVFYDVAMIQPLLYRNVESRGKCLLTVQSWDKFLITSFQCSHTHLGGVSKLFLENVTSLTLYSNPSLPHLVMSHSR